LHNGMNMNCTIIEVKTNPDRVNSLIEKAYDILNGEIPESGEKCEHCKWINQVTNDKYGINKYLDDWLK